MRRKAKFLIPALTALLAVGVVLAVLVVLQRAPAFAAAAAPSIPEPMLACGTCHTMDKEVSDWKASAHENVACLQCHEETDPWVIRGDLKEQLDKMAQHPTTGTPKALPMTAPQERCTDCHKQQLDQVMKDITPAPLKASDKMFSGTPGQPMTVKVAHDVHVNGKAQMKCADCHLDAVHGPAAGTTERKDEMHQLCLDCHAKQNVTLDVPGDTSCEACHTTNVAPHKDVQQQWLTQHGQAVETDKNCGTCHMSKTAAPQTGNFANPALFKSTAGGDICVACHSGVPMPHPAGYLSIHGTVSLSTGSGTCESCHSSKSPIKEAPTKAKQQDCTSCHAQPMPHPARFVQNHGQIALQEPETCVACHSPKNPANPNGSHASQQFCTSCHMSFKHPANWVAAHGTQVTEACATCHTMPGKTGTKPACASCHTGGPWHPQLWYVSHARAVEEGGKAQCMTCHNYVQPSCTKCHKDM